jgi:hypothetical protein
VTVAASQIRYLDADESRTSQAQDAVTKKEEEVTGLKNEIARLTALVEEERRKNEEARKETDTYRKSLLSHSASPSPDPAQQAEITRLQNEVQRLNAEKTQALAKIENLEKDLAQVPLPQTDASPRLGLQPWTCENGKAAGLTLAQTTLDNPTSESFGLVVLEVTAYDKNNRALDTVHTFLTRVEPHTSRPVRASLEIAPDKIDRVQSFVVDVFKETPPLDPEKNAVPPTPHPPETRQHPPTPGG